MKKNHSNTIRVVVQGALPQEEEPEADTLHDYETLTVYLRERAAFIRVLLQCPKASR